MQEIQGNMDDVLSGNDLRDDEKDKRLTFSCKTDIWLYLSWLVLLQAFISSVFHLILVKLTIVFFVFL